MIKMIRNLRLPEADVLVELGILAGGLAVFSIPLYCSSPLRFVLVVIPVPPLDCELPWFIWVGLAAGLTAVVALLSQFVIGLPEIGQWMAQSARTVIDWQLRMPWQKKRVSQPAPIRTPGMHVDTPTEMLAVDSRPTVKTQAHK